MITEKQTQHYWEKGWVVVENVFAPEEADHIAEVAMTLCETEAQAKVKAVDNLTTGANYNLDISDEGEVAPRKIDKPFQKKEAFRNFILAPKLLGILEQLLGGQPLLVTDQIFMKPPRFGSAKPYHQDNAYFLCSPSDQVITAWIALDDVSEANGCLRYIDGSHKSPILSHAALEGEEHHKTPAADLIDLNMESLAPVKKGGVIFHHSHTLHTSHRNESDRWRRAYATHWATAEVTSDGPVIEDSYYRRGVYDMTSNSA